MQSLIFYNICSADLFVANDVESANDTTYEVYLEYQRGEVSGPIKTANLSLGGLNIPEQAFGEHHSLLLSCQRLNHSTLS
jgi:hypothetical protein